MPTKKPFILSVKDEERHSGSRGTTFITSTAMYWSHEYKYMYSRLLRGIRQSSTLALCTRFLLAASGLYSRPVDIRAFQQPPALYLQRKPLLVPASLLLMQFFATG